ncbi:MAG: uroporphyrinogen decarboxylase family protein [Sphaerochaetaceae bacterium]|nr:uroporphyrinogen decarboxylase family protein [Sphaerochaetaceae bacterium]
MQPDFNELLTVLERKSPSRPVLFEFYMNDNVYDTLVDPKELPSEDEDIAERVKLLLSFYRLGYDYATLLPPKESFFPELREHHDDRRTYSLNEGSHIDSWKAFEEYPWPDYSDIDYSYLEKVTSYLPEGMKLIPSGPGGVEEVVISLTGYENLCYMMVDDEDLVDALFEAVGSRLVKYYKEVAAFDSVGACLSNDDWGFKTQTLLSPSQMERWLIPWHRKISQAIHDSHKPALLHTCGNVYPVFNWISESYEGKHSYEDSILPVEDAWETYHDQIAILGGIDVNYMIMESQQNVYERSRALLERTAQEGSFALGTGNSVPDYLPNDKYFAMLKAAWDLRGITAEVSHALG